MKAKQLMPHGRAVGTQPHGRTKWELPQGPAQEKVESQQNLVQVKKTEGEGPNHRPVKEKVGPSKKLGPECLTKRLNGRQ